MLLQAIGYALLGAISPTALVVSAVFLASDAAGFVNGHVLAVDGGFLASGVNQ